MSRQKTAVTWLLPVAFVIILPLLTSSKTTACSILIYAVATMACNLLLGYAGLLSFCQGTFFGIGGYVSGILLMQARIGFAGSLVAAILGSALVAGLIGFVSIRRKGLYFVMLTLAFAHLFYFIAYSLPGITGGDNGLNGVPRPTVAVAGHVLIDLNHDLTLYGLVTVAFLAVYVLLHRVVNSPLGSVLAAIRENETRVGPLGYDSRHYKVLAFMISGAITGLAGALDGVLLGIVPLSNIDTGTSQTILIAAILGGSGSLFGSVLGATGLVVAGDVLSDLWPRWQMILGVLLVLLVLFTPDGLSGLWRMVSVRLGRARGRRTRDEVSEEKQWTTF